MKIYSYVPGSNNEDNIVITNWWVCTKGNVKHEFAKRKARITVMYYSYRVKVMSLWRIVYTQAGEIVQLLTQWMPDFIPSPNNTVAWPPNIPDLNLVDYSLGCNTGKVYKIKIVNVDELCDRIVNASEELDQRVIDAAVRQCACVYALVCSLEVDTLNIFCDWNKPCDFEWLVPCLLLNCKHQSFFWQKLRWGTAVLLQFSESCILQGMRQQY